MVRASLAAAIRCWLKSLACQVTLFLIAVRSAPRTGFKSCLLTPAMETPIVPPNTKTIEGMLIKVIGLP